MHYLLVLPFLMMLLFATGGYGDEIGQALKRATDGRLVEAVDLLSGAVRKTLRDADPKAPRDAEATPRRE